MKSSTLFAFVCASPLLGCAGWSVSARPAPIGYVETTAAPIADIDLYPSTIYEGRTVYLYGDRWYWREGSRWRSYDREPRALAPYRERLRRQPPMRRPGPQRDERRRAPTHREPGDRFDRSH